MCCKSFVASLLLSLCLASSSLADSMEKVFDACWVQMDRMGATLTLVKDVDTAKKAATELQTIRAELVKIAARCKALGFIKPEDAAKFQQIASKKRAAFEKRYGSLEASLSKAGPEAIEILQEGMKDVGAAFAEFSAPIPVASQ